MRVNVRQEQLSKIIALCERVSEKKSTMPILSHGLISVTGERLEVLTTDLEVYARATISCQVQKEGKVCIPMRHFSSIVRDLTANEVQLGLNENGVFELICGNAAFRLNTLPWEDFPVLDMKLTHKELEVKAGFLQKALDHTLFSSSSDEVQTVLNSVLFDFPTHEKWFLVSTDRHRLSYFDMIRLGCENKQWVQPLTGRYLLPRKGASELRNLCELVGSEKMIRVYEAQQAICFQCDSFVLYVRLMGGTFPAFEHILQKREANCSFLLNRSVFLGALRRISILSSEKLRAIQLTFSQDHIQLYCTSEILGDAKEVVVPESVEGSLENPVEITFNARYLLEPLGVFTGEKIRILVKDRDTHMTFLPDGEPYYQSLVMPLRV